MIGRRTTAGTGGVGNEASEHAYLRPVATVYRGDMTVDGRTQIIESAAMRALATVRRIQADADAEVARAVERAWHPRRKAHRGRVAPTMPLSIAYMLFAAAAAAGGIIGWTIR